MYRWQTLTLAKIEARVGNRSDAKQQVETAKNLLFHIGLQHFPEPTISFGVHVVDRLQLGWQVDSRTLEFCISPDNLCSMQVDRDLDRGASTGLDLPADANAIRSLVDWLLFDSIGSEFSLHRAPETQAGLV